MMRAKHSATGSPVVLNRAERHAALDSLVRSAWVGERGGRSERIVLRRAVEKLGRQTCVLAIDEAEALSNRLHRCEFVVGTAAVINKLDDAVRGQIQ